MDLLTLAQLDAQGFFEDAEENPQLGGLDAPTWAETSAARAAANEAKQLKAAGNYAAAAEQYASAIRAGHPNKAACYGKRADCLGRVGRLEEALTDFAMATRLEPSRGSHLAGRAYTLKLLGRTKEAIAVAADAVACGNHPPAEALHAELLRAARLDQMAQTLPDAAQASTHAGAECTEDDAD
jgi:tetratricopeptide (TPR) repeat protein